MTSWKREIISAFFSQGKTGVQLGPDNQTEQIKGLMPCTKKRNKEKKRRDEE